MNANARKFSRSSKKYPGFSYDYYFKKVLPGLFIACTISIVPVYSQQIILDGRTNTHLETLKNTTTITTTTIKNDAAFNSFSKFIVDQDHTVNLMVPEQVNHLINLVTTEPTSIYGTINSVHQNHIGGHVYFANPHGFIVGPTGVLNVGSLTAVTPTTHYMQNFFNTDGSPNDAATRSLINHTVPINLEGEINIQGNIKAAQSIHLSAGHVQTTGHLSTGESFQDNNLQPENIVNLNILEAGADLLIEDNSIKIESKHDINHSGKIVSDGSPNSVSGTIHMTADKNIHLNAGSLISAKGHGENSHGGHIFIYAQNATQVNQGAEINAQGSNHSGHGGFIEVSGKNEVNLNGGKILAGSTDGIAGTILIDPDALNVNANDFTDGAHKTYTADTSITVNNDVIISSRNIADPTNGNHLTDLSQGNSGNLTFSAPHITFNPGSQVYAHANNSFNPGNISINPTGTLNFNAATTKTEGNTTINDGDVTTNGITFIPTSLQTGTITSDFITPGGDFNVTANNAHVNVGNLDNISINGSGPNFTNINIASNRETYITGNLTAANDINITSSPPNVWQGSYDDARLDYSTLNAGRDINITSNSINSYEGVTITNSTLNAGRHATVNALGDITMNVAHFTANNDINAVAQQAVEIQNSTFNGTNVTINPGSGNWWDNTAGRLVFTNSTINASNNLYMDYGNPGSAGGIGFRPYLINAQSITSDFLVHNSALTIPNQDNWAGSSVYLGNLDKVYINGTQLRYTGLNIPWRQDVRLDEGITIHGPINVSASWLYFYSNPTLTSYGTPIQKTLLVNPDNNIDPSSNIAATVGGGIVDVGNFSSGNGGSITLNAPSIFNSVTFKSLVGESNINMTNNSPNSFTINNINSSPIAGSQVNINGTVYTTNGISGNQTFIFDDLSRLGKIEIANNGNSDITLSGTIQKTQGDVHITNTQGNILAGNTDAVINAQNIKLNATNGSIGNSYVKADITTGALTAYGKTHVHIQSSNIMPIDNIISNGNDVSLIAGGPITDARTGELPNIYGRNIELTSTNGTLGTLGEDLDLYLNYKSTGGTLTATSINGLMNLYHYYGNTPVNKIFSKQNVTLSSRDSIIDGNTTDSVNNIYGRGISLTSTLGTLGTPTDDLDLYLNYYTTGGLLDATAINGSINLYQAAGDMVLNRVISKQDVNLYAKNNILDGSAGDSIPNIYGKNITLTSTVGSLGSPTEDLDLYLNYSSTGGLLNATASNGPINLYQYYGNMALNKIFSKQDVNLYAKDSIVDGNADDSILNIYGKNITLTSTLGSLGSPTEDLDLYLNYYTTGGVLNATASNGPINLYQYYGNMALNKIFSKQDVNLYAKDSIVDGNADDSILNVYGKNITLTSTLGSLGVPTEDLDLYLNYYTTGGVLNATASNGPINLYQYYGNMALNKIFSKQDVNLYAKDNIVDGNAGDSILNVYGKNITLTSTLGSLGSPTEDLDLYLNYYTTGGLLNATASNGPINLYQYYGDMILNKVISKQDIKLVSRDSIIDGSVGDAVINVYGKNITLTSTLGSLGTPTEDLDLYLNYATTGGVLTSTALNNVINLHNTVGHLYLNTIKSNNDVTLNSAGGIYTNTALPVMNILGNNLILNSPIGIGTTSNPIEVDVTGTINTTSPATYVHAN